MKLVRNAGGDRVIDLVRPWLTEGGHLDLVTPSFALFAFADLRNQIAFATEGDDTSLAEQGIGSIDSTTRLAQKQFNRWLEMEDADRTPTRLIDMLGFDYFTLLDLLTIARSRKHIEKYYGIEETGRFPDRLKPINIKADVDLTGEFRSIRDINLEIRRLTLAAYAPLRYVLPHKQAPYDAKYSTQIRGGEGFFRQVDREESLIHLLRVNVSKRMESAVPSFTLTVPGWFKVPTPLGSYNPDWAVLIQDDDGERLYFVVETKGSMFGDDLRKGEAAKIECGKAHFAALKDGDRPVQYRVKRTLDELLASLGD